MTRNSRRNMSAAIWVVELFGFAASNLIAQRVTPWASHDINGNPVTVPIDFSQAIAYFACVGFASGLLQFRRPEGSSAQRQLVKWLEALGALLLGAVAFLALYAIFKYQLIGRYIVLVSILGSVAVITVAEWLRNVLADEKWRRVLFVVPDGISTTERDAILSGAREFPGEYSFQDIGAFAAQRPFDMASRLRSDRFTDIVFDYDENLRKQCASYVLPIINKGIRVLGMETLLELYSQKLDLRLVDEAWFLTFENDLNGRFALRIKRFMDLSASFLILMACVPVLPFVALAVKLQDGGPILYRQKRKGLNGRVFDILKFRTMRMDSEKHGAVWASKKDARVTRVGRFLRKSRLDELPQLINILRGEMSFVGPRPERPEMVQKIVESVPHFELRELVKPGLTGWAQVKYPYGASIEDAREKLAYDLYYVKHASISLDCYIIAKTAFVITRGSR